MKFYTTLTVFYMLLIICLSHIPQDDISEIVSGPENIDIFFHYVEYLILGFLLFQSITTDDFFTINSIYGSILIGILFSISDEFHQNFVPGRHMSLFDILYDIIGLIFGIYIGFKTTNRDLDNHVLLKKGNFKLIFYLTNFPS